MPSLTRLLPLTLLALTVDAATRRDGVVPPALQGVPDSVANTLTLNGTSTDTSSIVSTVGSVNQKTGATAGTPPNQTVAETTVTAIDGQVVNATVSSVTGSSPPSRRSPGKRDGVDLGSVPAGYHRLFDGTGPAGGSAMDASIQGTAYLTYTVVPNSTYSINPCLNYCSSVPGCVFANLYYEFNNELLDFVFSEHSNLKCALYGDIHFANEKTNFGGQQSYPAPGPLTYIQDSTGWAADSLYDPRTPDGYSLVFGPVSGANNAPGYMGFTFIDKYDVSACAALCNARDPDPNGGACQYFNIWRALVSGVPTTYTCAFYYVPTDQSTAVNYGQGNLQVTYSRGYRRQDLVIDGGFESLSCGSTTFCFTESSQNWVTSSSPGGTYDATLFLYTLYAHSGQGSGLLGSAFGTDALTGSLEPAQPLATVAGTKYIISFFHNSAFSGNTLEANAFVDILWNGNIVATITPGYSPWKYYAFSVTAVGNDKLAFHGGKAPAWSFLDDIHVFQQ